MRAAVMPRRRRPLCLASEPVSVTAAVYVNGPQQLIAAYQRIVASAHAHGKTIYVGTLMPAQGFEYWSDAAERKRRAVNDWLRGGHGFDGVIDFAALMAYPGHPELLAPEYDSGDHLHPNDTGNQVMAAAVERAVTHR
jgi:lysophospholipase L1-like esterase